MLLLSVLACSTPKSSADLKGADDTALGLDTSDDDSADPCEEGVVCVDSFPFHAEADTLTGGTRTFDAYSCSPDTDESGPELIWRVDLPAAGFLSAALTDNADAGVDIDVHLLSARDAAACLGRGNFDAGAHVEAGTYYVVADTFVSDGEEQSGSFSLDIGFVIPNVGSCAMLDTPIGRYNTDDLLSMPATGPIVLEAHLVTEDDGFGESWPESSTDGLDAHYAQSQVTTAFIMHREQDWAPQEGCEYGQGAWGSKLPEEDEGWYVNMYWTDRPDPGTRMILTSPEGRSVVTAAGYETGPGDLEHIAGTTEEVHFYMGTGHLDTMTVGFAADNTLPLGPIVCE